MPSPLPEGLPDGTGEPSGGPEPPDQNGETGAGYEGAGYEGAGDGRTGAEGTGSLAEDPSAGDEPPPIPRVIQLRCESGGGRLDVFLARQLAAEGYSREYVQELIETGHVSFEPPGRREPKCSYKLRSGQAIRVVIPPPLRLRLRPEPIPIEFLYQDEHLAVLIKPAGLSVHPAPDQVGSTLVNALLHWLDDLSGIAGVERPGIVHRLDKETSGVMLVAKNDRAHHGLSSQFRERTIHKTYQAIVRGEPVHWEGRIEGPIGRKPNHSKKMQVRQDGTGRSAVTDYRILEVFRGYSLVECYPHTGRTHQIRVHLASLRLPVAGDKLYGRERRVYASDLLGRPRASDEAPLLDRHALHAAGISFRHPITQEEMTYSAPLPDDMLSLLRALQTYRSPP